MEPGEAAEAFDMLDVNQRGKVSQHVSHGFQNWPVKDPPLSGCTALAQRLPHRPTS